MIICEACLGEGQIDGGSDQGDTWTCVGCNGSGIVMEGHRARKKLNRLLDQGWKVSRVSISRQEPNGSWRHGFVTEDGFVGWHQNNTQNRKSGVDGENHID